MNLKHLYGSQITKEIWGNVQNIVLIYMGSAAEFALNPELDWLFFTGQVNRSPQDRFIRTFRFNQKLAFTPADEVPKIAAQIRNIHSQVEKKRSDAEGVDKKMSAESFRQVQSQLIDYGIKGWEYLNQRQMPYIQKEKYYQDVVGLGTMMGIQDMPNYYSTFEKNRNIMLPDYLVHSKYTTQLYDSYERDFGLFGIWLIKHFQAHFAHPEVTKKLNLQKKWWFKILYDLYPKIKYEFVFYFIFSRFVREDTLKALKQMGELGKVK